MYAADEIVSRPAKREDHSDHFMSLMVERGAVMKLNADLLNIDPTFEQVPENAVFESFNVHFDQIDSCPTQLSH